MKSKGIAILMFILVLLSAETMKGQASGDVIYLKNGSIIKGKITERGSESTKIQTSDGREYTFKNTEIERSNGENAENKIENSDNKPLTNPITSTERKYTPMKRGFWNSTDFQLWAPLSLNMVNGYKFNRFAYLGLGLGLNNYTGLVLYDYNNDNFNGIIMPVYVRYGGDVLDRRVTPTYFVEAGYGMVVSDEPIIFLNNKNIKKNGGFYGGLGFGFKVRTNKHLSFGVSLAYKYQQASSMESYYTTDFNGNIISNTAKTDFDMHRFGLKVNFIGFN